MAIAAVSHVESILGVNGGTSGSHDTTGANLLTVAISWYSSTGAGTPSDSKGNSYTGLTTRTGQDTSVRLWYSAGTPTVGSSHTHTYAVASSYSSVAAASWSGAAASPYDGENGANLTSWGTSLATGSLTPSEANCLLVSAIGFSVAGTESITLLSVLGQANVAAGTAYGVAHAYEIQTSATARNPTWSGSNGARAAEIASFKAAAASGHPAIKRFGGVPYAALNRGVW